MPDIDGKELCINSDEALDLEMLPKSIVINGGGYIALEFAGIFSSFGSKVTLVYRGKNILRGFDSDISKLITEELKKALGGTILGKISSILNISNLRKFKKRLDPRLYNGAIFIGLDSPVVKSHGGTDYIGFSNSLDVCHRIVKGNLIKKIKHNIWYEN